MKAKLLSKLDNDKELVDVAKHTQLKLTSKRSTQRFLQPRLTPWADNCTTGVKPSFFVPHGAQAGTS